MDPINPRQVLSDMESIIGQREMIRHCAAYLREKNILLSPDGAIFPISWTRTEVQVQAPEGDDGINEELKEINRRVQKGMGTKDPLAPGAPKKPVTARDPTKFGTVARTLSFSPIKSP